LRRKTIDFAGLRSSILQSGFLLALLGATFLMGSSFVAGKILLQAAYPPLSLVGWRFFVAALATLPLIPLETSSFGRALFPVEARLRHWLLAAIIGLLQTAAVMALLFLAMRTVSASTAAILLFTNPIWVSLLGRLFLHEALHTERILGLLLGIGGVTLALGLHRGGAAGVGAHAGELLGLASAVCWAAATILNKRAALPFGPWALTFWQMLIGALAVLLIAYLSGEHWPKSMTPGEWGWFLWLAIPASTGSFGLWFVALSKGGATRASSYLFLAPLFAVALSFLVLGSSIDASQALGGGLVGIALWLVNREPRHAPHPAHHARSEHGRSEPLG
jgi:drug/metabolite transporter (DMT)-like permease